MNNKSYNGWTNYETWNVKLWMDNDGSLDFWNEQVGEAIRKHGEDAEYNLGEQLKDYHQDNMPEVSGTYADLLQASLSEVNWCEIAEALIRDYKDEHGVEDEETQPD